MIKISNIKIFYKKNQDLKKAISKKLKIQEEEILDLKIIKKSLDARDKSDIKYVYTVAFKTNNEKKLFKNKDVTSYVEKKYKIEKSSTKKRPVIIGFGPCGMFCGLIMSYAGLNPIILERGNEIDKRKIDVLNFSKNSLLNEESNMQFGEGGAGTFSDGKLTTGINDPRINEVLKIFASNGADEEIKYLQKPHIGTDVLVDVVKNIRKKIISLGGEIRFSHKLESIETFDNRINNILVKSNGNTYALETDHLILSIGHSARDTYEMLLNSGINMSPKPFSVGFRVEHNQKYINKLSYGDAHKFLPPSDYKLNYKTQDNRGVYTFCMCPGGYVVACSSEKNMVVTNGMSYFDRNNSNANAAILVNVNSQDYFKNSVLDGITFQRNLEQKAFEYGGNNYFAPVQLLGDFLLDKPTKELGNVFPSYTPGFNFANLHELLPSTLTKAIKEGIINMDRRLKGFNLYDAVLTGVETRSSSPIRINRDASFESNIKGIFPVGEGAGYSGGIMSSCVDGMKCAEIIIANTSKPLENFKN